MAIEVGSRPPQIDGCWQTWSEQDVDAVIRTEYATGVMRTRRRFTGVSRVVNASVTMKADLFGAFMSWYRVNQKQGSIATLVMTPYGDEEVFQWAGPPSIEWVDPNAFKATVVMFQGADF